MSEILIITNRTLCRDDFFARLEQLAKAQPKAIVLREKDLSEQEYMALAKEVIEICEAHGTTCILHSFVQAAKALQHDAMHLPLPVLRTLTAEDRKRFSILGASCHSTEDAKEAERLGCTYITAGHVFDTDCKKGLPGRGLGFLRNVCRSVSIPVYAIGGITPENTADVLHAGAKGICVMSGAMTCAEPSTYLAAFEEKKHEV